jgi:hypothetical protein
VPLGADRLLSIHLVEKLEKPAPPYLVPECLTDEG